MKRGCVDMYVCAKNVTNWYCVVGNDSYVKCLDYDEESDLYIVESLGLGMCFALKSSDPITPLVAMDAITEEAFLNKYCADGKFGDRCMMSLIGYDDYDRYLYTNDCLVGELTAAQEDRIRYFYTDWTMYVAEGNDDLVKGLACLLRVSDRFGVDLH